MTATSAEPITTDELNAQMEEALKLIKETPPEYRKSICVPEGQAYIIDPNELGYEFWGFKEKTVILNPDDYANMFPEELEELEED